jgi:hypothetical protein
LIKRAARVILLSSITALLLMPVLPFTVISTNSVRILITIISNIIYLSVLSELAKSRTMELAIAGAA